MFDFGSEDESCDEILVDQKSLRISEQEEVSRFWCGGKVD